jgi:hypothetical protein
VEEVHEPEDHLSCFLGDRACAALLGVRARVTAHGLNVPLLIEQLFANRISAFFGLDVIVSSLVFLVFVQTEAVRVGNIRRIWLPVIALLVAGVSLALPLFLYLRESAFGNGRRVQAVKA